MSHVCGMDVVLCMALGRHPTPPGTEADTREFYRRIRRHQRRALRRARKNCAKIRRMLADL